MKELDGMDRPLLGGDFGRTVITCCHGSRFLVKLEPTRLGLSARHRVRRAHLVAPSVPAQVGVYEGAMRIVFRLVRRLRCLSWRPQRSVLDKKKKWLAQSFPPPLGGIVPYPEDLSCRTPKSFCWKRTIA